MDRTTAPHGLPNSSRLRFAGLGLFLIVCLSPEAGRAQLQTVGSLFLDQNSDGVAGTAELGDRFGATLATGDFNCDGIADLAVGVPWEEDNGDTHAGAVNVFYGGPAGLTGAEIWTQDSAGVPGGSEPHDHFGLALASFKSRVAFQDCDHLAVGAPDEDVDNFGDRVNAGAVYLFLGTPDGLVPDGLIVQGRDGVPESAEANDRFGAAISQGPPVAPPDPGDACPGANFDLTLVIGAPGEGLGFQDNGDGALLQLVMRCTGSSGGGESGIIDCSSDSGGAPCRRISADDFDLPLDLDPYDHFGAPLAFIGRSGIGGVPQTAWEFLAVGIPSANRVNPNAASIGAVLEADPSWAGGSEYWSQTTSGVQGSPESSDRFATALATGDFNDDGRPDLAIGVPFEDDEAGTPVVDAGAIQVLHNSSTGLTATADFLAVQRDLAIGETETNDFFGAALASGDFDGDGVADLAIGAPGENLSGNHPVTNAGAINVLYGVDGIGLTLSGTQQFDADDLLFNAALTDDAFGAALAAGDFDGNGVDDLAIGVPGPDDGSDTLFGTIAVLYGTTGGALGAVTWVDGTLSSAELATTIQVSVTRSGSAVVPLQIGYATDGGSATENADFIDTSGVLSWAAGELGTKSFSVGILADTLDETNESFTVRLTGGGGAVTRPNDAVVTILDDDTGGQLSFLGEIFQRAEGGNAIINVRRQNGAASAVTVDYATADGTATAGVDYVANSGTLTFSASSTLRTFPVTTLDDGTPDGCKTVRLSLSGAGGGGVLIPPTEATLYIGGSPGTLLFCDGFDDGDTDHWSAVVD